MPNQTLKYTVAGAILLSAAAYLAYASMKDGWACYHLPVDAFLNSPQYQNQRVRLAGQVSTENLHAGAGRLNADFDLVANGRSVTVKYHGIVPEMFRPGGEVVVEGKLESPGVFKADVMMTKCASKYEAKVHGAAKEKAS